MKFSALLIASIAASTQAFAPASTNAGKTVLSAATLEVPTEAPKSEVAVAASDMGVEKDWPVEENFVKDSDRILP